MYIVYIVYIMMIVRVMYMLWCEVWCIGQSAVRWVCLGEKGGSYCCCFALRTVYLTA